MKIILFFFKFNRKSKWRWQGHHQSKRYRNEKKKRSKQQPSKSMPTTTKSGALIHHNTTHNPLTHREMKQIRLTPNKEDDEIRQSERNR